jgi:hypothetical protein
MYLSREFKMTFMYIVSHCVPKLTELSIYADYDGSLCQKMAV